MKISRIVNFFAGLAVGVAMMTPVQAIQYTARHTFDIGNVQGDFSGDFDILASGSAEPFFMSYHAFVEGAAMGPVIEVTPVTFDFSNVPVGGFATAFSMSSIPETRSSTSRRSPRRLRERSTS